jgi:hypothetical protein
MTDKRYCSTEENDTAYGGAREVVEKEIEHIRAWRGREPQAGIALSGGGIRSASFCLGALQALAYGRWLPEFDYLSTVSGGGYTGSSLSYLLHYSKTMPGAPTFDVSKDHFPYLSYPMVGAPLPEKDTFAEQKGALLRRLRQNAKYLTPGNGVTLLSLIGVVLRNSAASVFVHVALLVLILMLLIGYGFFGLDNHLAPGEWYKNRLLWISLASFGVYALFSVLYVPLTGFFDVMIGSRGSRAAYWARRRYEQAAHWTLLIGIAVLIVAVLPWVYGFVRTQYALYVSSGSSVLGILSSVWAYLQTSKTKKPKIPTGVVVAVASALLLFGVLLLAYHVAHLLHDREGGWWTQLLFLIVALAFLGWIPNVNYLSVHRFYRDRLMETFMPDQEAMEHPDRRSGPTWTGNRTMMGRLCGASLPDNAKKDSTSCGPYHIVNTNIVLVSSENPRYRGRGGDNFIFSPLFSGSHATGWSRTDPNPKSGVTLATAMAISGAAVNPDTGCGGEGITRQPVLSVLMSLLNIRLGYWLKNPKLTKPDTASRATETEKRLRGLWSSLLSVSIKPNMIYPGILESFGRNNLREDKRYVLLSDGGHFENLGLYELIRRRLKLIVVFDGAADPKYGFGDLANCIEKVRADFGAIVWITSADLDHLVPHRRDKYPAADPIMPVAERGYLDAKISYAPLGAGKGTKAGANEGRLIYMSTTFLKTLSADLHGYRQAHPEFPNEPTSDQFFDEKQFESYRELGYLMTWGMMSEESAGGRGSDVNMNGVHLPKVKA